jgi:RimJ/RimL family protein N-acetyltransferase
MAGLSTQSLSKEPLSPQRLRQGQPILWTHANDGERFFIRPVLPVDKPKFQRGLDRLSMRSRQLRFLSGVASFTTEQLKFLTEVDQENHVCWVAVVQDGSAGLGVARYARLEDQPAAAEMAVTVIDAWQERGVGRQLLGVLATTALARGMACFEAEVAPDNQVMRHWLGRLGAQALDEARLRLPLGVGLVERCLSPRKPLDPLPPKA